MNNKRNNLNIRHTPEIELEPGLVSPIIAAVISIFIPGLGQILSRAVRRGVIILFSVLSILGLMAWRFNVTAPRDTGWINIIKKALRLDLFLIIISILFIILYILSIIDAYTISKYRDRTPIGIFFMIIVVFFALGWQIGQIDLVAFVRNADDALPILQRIAWPWEKAFDYPKEYMEAFADVEVPCSTTPPDLSTAPPDEPLLITSPTCGILSKQGETVGTTLHLEGRNFLPENETQIMWKDPIGNEFRQRQEGAYVKVIPDNDGNFEIDIIMPYRLLPPSADQEFYIWQVFGRQVSQVGDPILSIEIKLIVEKIIETIFIGMMATLFGVIFALPISFFAARNLMSTSPITLLIYYLTRAVLNIIRSIEPLIWAIIAVVAVGLGPFAGIVALTLHSIAALAKLYSESIESIDTGPIEAIHATGATWLQTIVFAVIPQIIPPFVSFTIYRWDINIRMSTIVGFVGGGGIGFLLAQYIRLLEYRSAGMAIWFIAITVAILDYVSAEIRARFV